MLNSDPSSASPWGVTSQFAQLSFGGFGLGGEFFVAGKALFKAANRHRHRGVFNAASEFPKLMEF